MASNGYPQSYRQGPPPQRQYDNDQYERRNYGRSQQNQAYNQQSYDYDGYQNDHYDQRQYPPSNDHYEQYEQREQWDNRQDRQPPNQDRYNQRPQQYEPGPRQQGPYQYDDRYRDNGQPKPSMTYGPGRPPMRAGDQRPYPPNDCFEGMSQGNGGYNQGGYGGNRLPKPRERILQQEPESPKTAAWDNPFPTFPSKKKSSETKRSDSNGERKYEADVATPSNDGQRPSTSHSNRAPRAELSPKEPSRPHTSQSQRNFEPLRSPVDVPAVPQRTDVPPPRPHTSNSQRNTEQMRGPSYPPEMPYRQDFPGGRPQPGSRSGTPAANNPSRPVPQRAMTGPAPSYSLDDYFESDDTHRPLPTRSESAQNGYGLPDMQGYGNPQLNGFRRDSDGAEMQLQHVSTSAQASYSNNVNGHRRQSSDQSYTRNQRGNYQDRDRDRYQDGPPIKPLSPDLPNFDAMTDNASEKVDERYNQPNRQPQPIYRKPVYQDVAPNPSQSQQQQTVDNSNHLAAPLSQFSFGLGNDEPPKTSYEMSQDADHWEQQQSEAKSYDSSRQPPPPGPHRPTQYDQRGINGRQAIPINRGDDGFAPNRPPKANLPFRPGLAQPPTQSMNYEREYSNFDHDRSGQYPGYAQDPGRGQPVMPNSPNLYQREPPRQGHDPRGQPRPGFGPPQQGPPRPATSNSGRPGPVPDYGARSTSDNYLRTGMQNPDSLPAHPAPFRPGLMQPTPAAGRPAPHGQSQPQPQPQPQSQPQMHQRAPSAPKSSEESEPSVTIRELNTLQQEYKNNPNDYALGLRFAKRLVEAAKVLANENGRADAKQTAKNRERYILDAHKTVKRLCSSGYSEAMFYLADCYGQGLLGLEPDAKEAFSLYQSAAKLGHAQAAYRVAVCCELGSEEGGGTRRDPLKAVQWYKRGASLGDTPAMYKMGMIQLKGLLGQPKSPREAISWLKRAAERADAENPHALHELGLLYENAQPNDIALKDEKYALQLFQQAADLGYKYSQFRLGSAYEYGLLGLPIDPRMSIAWYSRAAKQGEHQSEFALSGWYLTGSGSSSSSSSPPGEPPLLPQSDTEAYLWARKAASSGLAKAEYAMGYYTEVGIGIASNIEEAKRWYYRAAAQNHLKARERLEDLKKGGQRMQKTRVSRSNVGKHNEGECVVM